MFLFPLITKFSAESNPVSSTGFLRQKKSQRMGAFLGSKFVEPVRMIAGGVPRHNPNSASASKPLISGMCKSNTRQSAATTGEVLLIHSISLKNPEPILLVRIRLVLVTRCRPNCIGDVSAHLCQCAAVRGGKSIVTIPFDWFLRDGVT